MKIIILTMPLVIAEYLPRPSAVDARPALEGQLPTETLTHIIVRYGPMGQRLQHPATLVAVGSLGNCADSSWEGFFQA